MRNTSPRTSKRLQTARLANQPDHRLSFPFSPLHLRPQYQTSTSLTGSLPGLKDILPVSKASPLRATVSPLLALSRASFLDFSPHPLPLLPTVCVVPGTQYTRRNTSLTPYSSPLSLVFRRSHGPLHPSPEIEPLRWFLRLAWASFLPFNSNPLPSPFF